MSKATHQGTAKMSAGKAVATEIMQNTETRTRRYNDRVAEAAYFRAEKRGFAPGHEMQDWLEAESEINRGTVHH
ncbi:MAG: DUF2934 domain-containing protein [Gammaproteobacteria bacterium]|nr:DUF2934 domain-containing protein [Gammaproteobacteria bacterium]